MKIKKIVKVFGLIITMLMCAGASITSFLVSIKCQNVCVDNEILGIIFAFITGFLIRMIKECVK